jgi:hypothetical protein
MAIDSRLHRQTIQPPPTPNRNTWHVTAPAPVGNTRTNPGGAGKLTEGLPLLTCQKPSRSLQNHRNLRILPENLTMTQ